MSNRSPSKQATSNGPKRAALDIGLFEEFSDDVAGHWLIRSFAAILTILIATAKNAGLWTASKRTLILAVPLVASVLSMDAVASRIDPLPAAEPDELWLLLNPKDQQLEVMLGDYPIVHYRNVSWGRGGIGVKQRQGDEVTPIGSFRIRWINRDSKYRLFFGFDYPNQTYADRGLRDGALTPAQYNKIVSAWQQDQVALQSTALGGAVGIHGLGNADLSIHQKLNWTAGCIALNNAQIDHLAKLVSIGTRVEIRP